MVVIGNFGSAAVGTMNDGIAAIVQVCIGRQHACGFYRGIGHAFSPGDSVPEYFQVSVNTYFLWRAGIEDICQIKNNSFLTSCGETEIVLSYCPSSMAIRNLETHSLCLPTMPLGYCDVDRRICVVDGSLPNHVH